MGEGTAFRIGLEERRSGEAFLLGLGQRKRGVDWATGMTPPHDMVPAKSEDMESLQLDAAIDVQLRGERALADHPDPFGDGPFMLERTASGFTLASQIEMTGKNPATIQVGPSDESR